MVKKWVLYYLCLLASLVLVLLFPGRVSSVFFFTLLSVPVASILMSLAMLAGFRYEQSLDRTAAIKGDTIRYCLTIRNKSPFLIPYITVSFHSAGSVYEQELCSRLLPAQPLSTVTHEILLPCKCRGAYEIGLKQLRITDYLGLFAIKQNIKPLDTVTVYPRIVPIPMFPVPAGADGESDRHGPRGAERTDSISDIRKYVSGDRIRSIHWKLSAKKDGLMVKNFEQASGAEVELLIDASGLAGGAEERAEAEDRLVECAVSLVWHFVSRSIPVTVWHCGETPERHIIRNAADFQGIYRILSEARFSNEACLPGSGPAERSGSVKTVAAVSTAPGEDLFAVLLKAKSSGCMPVLIHAMPSRESCLPCGEHRELLLQSGVAVLAYDQEKGLETQQAQAAV